MQWLKTLLSRLFGRRPVNWDALDYGKPSSEGDEARRLNDV